MNNNIKQCDPSPLSLPTLNIFNVKASKDTVQVDLVTKHDSPKNYASKPKHYPPANKEWFNSIYSYNQNVTKVLPSADHVILKLIKSYFNLYSSKLERKIKSFGSRRLRMRIRRLSTNRVLVSRPEIKHTNDKAVVTIYVYNRQKLYFLNKIKRIASIDQVDKLLPTKLKKDLIKANGPWPSNLKIKILKKKSIMVKSKVIKHKNVILKILDVKNKINGCSASMRSQAGKFKNYEIKYLKDYVTKSLRKELFSTYFKQLLYINKSKFNERYLLPLRKLARRVYSKEVEFNLVDLKYLYLNSYIFSETLVTKIRNRKNKLLRVLKTSLLMFKLAPMDRTAVYDQIYNRKRKPQNIRVQEETSGYLPPQSNSTALTQNDDALHVLLSKLDFNEYLPKLNDYRYILPNSSINLDYPLYLINTILNSIKHKYVSGIRLEAAGRLTKRNTAARSVFKLRYKGNIKNMDSSYKGLPTVLLRGYAKSNLQYTNLKSKKRIGSFGLKAWVSAT